MNDKYELFRVVAVNNDSEIPEQLGTKEKFWIRDGGVLYLLKFGRDGTGEDWAEKVVCEICELLELPHAHYELATYEGRRCVISRAITSEDDRLILGNEIINRITPDYNVAMSYRQQQHTVSRVLAALSRFTSNKNDALYNFLGYLMLDALVGNTDRHHENWGLINTFGKTVRLAPTFDHASSLGRELSDETRKARLVTKDARYSVHAFAAKAKSALYEKEHDTQPLSTTAAFRSASSKLPDNWSAEWVARLDNITSDAVRRILDRIPSQFMSDLAKQFAEELLAANIVRIREGRTP